MPPQAFSLGEGSLKTKCLGEALQGAGMEMDGGTCK